MSCTNLSRARQPHANGTSATAHRAAVRAGWVTGVTPTTGSLLRIDRVSQYVAIMPNPPRKIAGYGLTATLRTTSAWSDDAVHRLISTANSRTGLTTNRRSSRAASATKVDRPSTVSGRLAASVAVT